MCAFGEYFQWPSEIVRIWLRETLTIFASQIRERCKNDDGKVKKSQRTCNDNADQARESGWYIKSNLSKKVRVSKRAGERVKADEWSGKKKNYKAGYEIRCKTAYRLQICVTM